MIAIDDIIVPPPEPDAVLDFAAMFGRSDPVELEIGSGKGTFLLNRAKSEPQRCFLGVEYANQFFRYAADRIARWGLTNVRLMRTDAVQLVLHHIPPASITILHIYHPDPWPKRRHHRRRLIQGPFIAAAVNILVPGGRIAIQTDHADYFEQIQTVLANEPRLSPVPFDDHEAGIVNGRVASNFETKYLREGRAIYQIAAVRHS